MMQETQGGDGRKWLAVTGDEPAIDRRKGDENGR
jgi:hypothetical protein